MTIENQTNLEYDNFDIPDYRDISSPVNNPIDPYYLSKKFISYDKSKVKKENIINL